MAWYRWDELLGSGSSIMQSCCTKLSTNKLTGADAFAAIVPMNWSAKSLVEPVFSTLSSTAI